MTNGNHDSSHPDQKSWPEYTPEYIYFLAYLFYTYRGKVYTRIYRKNKRRKAFGGPCTLKENYALILLPVVTQFSIIEATREAGLYVGATLVVVPT